MRKVQAIIREDRLEAAFERLLLVGVDELTVTPVRGSTATPHQAVFRGGAYPVPFLSKAQIEWYGPDAEVDAVVRAIARAASTGEAGDGAIFVQEVASVVSIEVDPPHP
jgi:nitrogen regulatory protein P-II 1